MTDRHSGYIVVLEKNLRDDEGASRAVMAAIMQLKGVLTVKPLVGNATDQIAEERIRNEIGQELFKIIYPGYERIS